MIILVSGNKETKNPTVYGGGGGGTGSPATPLPRSGTVKFEAPVILVTISTAITYAENLPCATSALLRLCEVDYKLSDT